MGLGRRGLAPEIDAVDVAVREEQGAMVRMVVVFTRNVRAHGESPRDDGALWRAERRHVGLGRVGAKVVIGERLSANQHVHGIGVFFSFTVSSAAATYAQETRMASESRNANF